MCLRKEGNILTSGREKKLGISDNRAKGGCGTAGFSTPSMPTSSAGVEKPLVTGNSEKLIRPSSLIWWRKILVSRPGFDII